MDNSKLRVLLVEPGKLPEEIEIDSSLESMQNIVGGYIECIMPFDDYVAIVCNEEGKINGLPLNRAVYIQTNNGKKLYDIIRGTFFICSAPPESERFQDLSDEQIEKYSNIFKTINRDIVTESDHR